MEFHHFLMMASTLIWISIFYYFTHLEEYFLLFSSDWTLNQLPIVQYEGEILTILLWFPFFYYKGFFLLNYYFLLWKVPRFIKRLFVIRKILLALCFDLDNILWHRVGLVLLNKIIIWIIYNQNNIKKQ